MNEYLIKKFNLAYDNLYDLSSKLNNILSNKINILLDEMNKEVLSYGYEFKLNDKTQKFKLYKIKVLK